VWPPPLAGPRLPLAQPHSRPCAALKPPAVPPRLPKLVLDPETPELRARWLRRLLYQRAAAAVRPNGPE
jgi:hypothetical protein